MSSMLRSIFKRGLLGSSVGKSSGAAVTSPTTGIQPPHLDSYVPRLSPQYGYAPPFKGNARPTEMSTTQTPFVPDQVGYSQPPTGTSPNEHESAVASPVLPVSRSPTTRSNEEYLPQTLALEFNQGSILPPIEKHATTPVTESFDKPTCSLNLICYRSGSEGCVRRQIQVTSKSRWVGHDTMTFDKAVREQQGLITTDERFFHALHEEWDSNMRGFWRGLLSLKTLRQIRLLSYTPTSRPEIVPLDDFTLQEVFYAYKHPSSITTSDAWIDWVFRLRQEDRRHALEFVEGWSGFRIAIIGSVPWVAATLVGIVWVSQGGNAQTAFTVAGFILTTGTSLLALLAIVSQIES